MNILSINLELRRYNYSYYYVGTNTELIWRFCEDDFDQIVSTFFNLPKCNNYKFDVYDEFIPSCVPVKIIGNQSDFNKTFGHFDININENAIPYTYEIDNSLEKYFNNNKDKLKFEGTGIFGSEYYYTTLYLRIMTGVQK